MRTLTVASLILVLFAMSATADVDWETELGATCDEFHNHSGFVPGSYDVGVFIEDGYDTEVHYTNGDIDIPPPEGRNSWDTVLKCRLNPTTTTTPSTTTPTSTTTTQATTTTTAVTSTVPSTTTTVSTVPSTTTTTQAPTTTATTPPRPTTTSTTLSTTIEPTTTTTEVVATTDPPKELPLTGANLALLLLAAASLIMVGLLTIRRSDQ